MDERGVVTCFLRNDGQVLLFRRSDDVGSYPGRWGTVSGHLAPERDAPDDDPETAAKREVREETGLEDAVTLVRSGDPFVVEDEDRGTRWRVHPLLFDCARRDVDPNWETAAFEWVHPTEIRRRETVPDLWTSYDRVRPTVETVATDREHGSAWLSIRALEVLRDEAALASEYEGVAAIARELRSARPSMTVVKNRVNRVMASVDDRSTAAVEFTARAVIESAVRTDREAASVAAERLEGQRICTFSRSGTALDALDRADPEAVLVGESHPGDEGVAVAETLADDHDVTLTSDAALSSLLDEWDADAVLVGADTILPNGSVVNKIGTRGLALAADRESVPLCVVAAADKVSPDSDVDIEPSPETLYDGTASLTVENPLFDVTPADLIDKICTDEGVLDSEAVTAIAERHRSNREW